MLSLGIDPGTAIVGYGLVREHADSSLEAVAYGVIRTPSDLPMPQRLKLIYDDLTTLVARYRPDTAGVEELFFAKNVTTAITVAQGRGVILLALQTAGVRIREYKPNMVKQSIAGYGGADKTQMQTMIKMLLHLDSIPRPDDAADALAIAITNLQVRHFADDD
ncbi:MAG: crossover junction endodeoxyribonuclease RuvC [Anaerolineae bacterium]|jgi:crossover junction endodeoxyribonuclease RuvC|nr:crossover junction endodeoxyribonuclease RuvC [Anaerolineae bacterium]